MEESMFSVGEAALGPTQTPTLSEFLLSPGFTGAAIAVAAIVVLAAVMYTSRRDARRHDQQLEQQDKHRQERRVERERAAGIDRCWQRLVWMIDTASIEPAGLGLDHSEHAMLGLSPELTLAILKGLHREAKELGDQTLIDAAGVYLTQFGAVLAQEGGPLPDSKALNGHQEPAPESPAAPATNSTAPEPVAAKATTAQTGRRRA
jgi:hypothetical protein